MSDSLSVKCLKDVSNGKKSSICFLSSSQYSEVLPEDKLLNGLTLSSKG